MKLLISMKDFITKVVLVLFSEKFEELPTIIVIVFTACCFLQDLYMGSCVIFNRSIGFCMVFTAALKIRRFCVFRSILFILNLRVTCTVFWLHLIFSLDFACELYTVQRLSLTLFH